MCDLGGKSGAPNCPPERTLGIRGCGSRRGAGGFGSHPKSKLGTTCCSTMLSFSSAMVEVDQLPAKKEHLPGPRSVAEQRAVRSPAEGLRERGSGHLWRRASGDLAAEGGARPRGRGWRPRGRGRRPRGRGWRPRGQWGTHDQQEVPSRIWIPKASSLWNLESGIWKPRCEEEGA